MARSNKRKVAIQRDLRRLITLVTGFEEKDENFPICVQYVDSNIKYHRYLSPDSHKIHRAIDGLSEKFEVYSQGQKAADLKSLTAAFLDQPGLDGKDTGKTDVHYAILSLLINVANSPTLDYEREKKPEAVPEEADTFDWRSYLLEGEDLNFLSHASSDSDEESEEESDEEVQETKDKDNLKDTKDNRIETSESPRTNLSHNAPSTGAVDADEYAQLERTLVVEYWKGKGREEAVGGSHAACNMARDWASYQQRMNPYRTLQHQTVVTESQVVRETLWLLSGVTDLFVFRHDGHRFLVSPDVYVMHLTQESFENSLAPLMDAGQQVKALDTFVTDLVSQRCAWTSSERDQDLEAGPPSRQTDSVPPQTYLAFAACVSEFLTDFRAELVKVERRVMKQEETILLSSLTSELRPWLQKVAAVHKVILHGVSSASSWTSSLSACSAFTPRDLGATTTAGEEYVFSEGLEDTNSSNNNNCVKAALLLDTLYQSVFESDLTAQIDDGNLTCLLLGMLVKSCRPLLQIISDWINNGVLSDTASEFVLHRNKEIKSLDETFWEKAFVPSMQAPAEVSSTTSRSKTSTSQSSSFRPGSISSVTDKGETTGEGGLSHSPDFVVAAGPKLFQPILREAILTGKSMEMLENLGRMGEALNVNSTIYERPTSLYELFVEDMRQALAARERRAGGQLEGVDGSSSDLKDNAVVPGPHSTSVALMKKDATIERQLNLHGVKDTLMNINFAALFSDPSTGTEGRRYEPQVPITAECGQRPLMGVCGSCLYPHVTLRYRAVCSKLVQILKEEYNLMGCIHAMQRYYLMSSGEVMYDFYTPVFNKIASREHWRDYSLLEMFLHEAVEPVFPGDVSRLSVDIVGVSKSHQKSAINATDCIHLKYNVPWPVDVVISGRCQDLYNDVFTFLLQIKRAKYTLDELRFDDLSREQAISASHWEEFPTAGESTPRKTRVHQLHLLRFRLLYFVNSLHNYIMTRILHSTELEFGCQLDAAMDLDQIIRIHSQYAEAIHERCLLHPRLAMLREAVGRVLNLALTFGAHWCRGVDFTSGEAIQEVETELTRCVHFLSSFLQIFTKRGSYPHLESLAFAFASLQVK